MPSSQTTTYPSNLILNLYKVVNDEAEYERFRELLLEFQSKRQAEVFWGEIMAVARKHGVLVESKVE